MGKGEADFRSSVNHAAALTARWVGLLALASERTSPGPGKDAEAKDGLESEGSPLPLQVFTQGSPSPGSLLVQLPTCSPSLASRTHTFPPLPGFTFPLSTDGSHAYRNRGKMNKIFLKTHQKEPSQRCDV